MVEMEFPLITIFSLLSVMAIGSNATLPAEVYWNSKLPNIPIPRYLHNLMQSDMGTFWGMSYKDSDHPPLFFLPYDKYSSLLFFNYHKYDAVDSHVKLPNTTAFFVFDDLHAGKKMAIHLTKSTNKARILPRQVAESIPFSTKKLPEILKRFSIEDSSPQAKLVKETLIQCETPGIKREDKYCGTSLESVVDFIHKHVNNENAQILMNEVDKPRIPQEYTIMDVKYVGENEVVCHKQKYPYAVYYCHTLIGTKVYNAELVGADGSKAKAVAICHSDTSDWYPKHFTLLLLHMKQGEGTVCHFIHSDAFVVVYGSEVSEKASPKTNLLAKA